MKMTQFAKFANNATNQILGTSGLIRENLQSMFSYPDAINVIDPVTVTGDMIYIKDGAPLNAKRAIVYIEPLQSGTGVPSPDNVRIISGWGGANVIRAGKNLFGGLDFANSLHDASYTSIIDTINKTVTFDRYKTKTTNIWFGRSNQATIIITYSNNNYNNCLQWKYSDGTSSEIRLNSTNGEKITSVFRSDASKYVIGLQISYRSQAPTTVYYDETGIFEGIVTADNFIPYIGQTYNITFPSESGTVYGGVIDIINGVLTVDRAFYTPISVGAISTHPSSGLRYWTITSGLSSINMSDSNKSLYMSNIFIPAPGVVKGHFYVTSSGKTLIVVPYEEQQNIDNVNDASEWVSNAGAQFVYPLATPITYQFTPTNILMLNGINTIYADCGSMELEYYRREGGGNPYV